MSRGKIWEESRCHAVPQSNTRTMGQEQPYPQRRNSSFLCLVEIERRDDGEDEAEEDQEELRPGFVATGNINERVKILLYIIFLHVRYLPPFDPRMALSNSGLILFIYFYLQGLICVQQQVFSSPVTPSHTEESETERRKECCGGFFSRFFPSVTFLPSLVGVVHPDGFFPESVFECKDRVPNCRDQGHPAG